MKEEQIYFCPAIKHNESVASLKGTKLIIYFYPSWKKIQSLKSGSLVFLSPFSFLAVAICWMLDKTSQHLVQGGGAIHHHFHILSLNSVLWSQDQKPEGFVDAGILGSECRWRAVGIRLPLRLKKGMGLKNGDQSK